MNSRGEHGFAPATFLEPLDAVHGQEEEEWREVDDDDREFQLFTCISNFLVSKNIVETSDQQISLLEF